MVEFFQGWRRKIAVVTLVIACVFMGLWVKSRGRVDVIYIHSMNPHWVFISGCDKFLIMRGIRFTNIQRAVQEASVASIQMKLFVETGNWGIPYYAIELQSYVPSPMMSKVEVYPSADDDQLEQTMVPYWSVVLPLTLLSAFLLLTKPRKSTSKKTDEPIPNEGM